VGRSRARWPLCQPENHAVQVERSHRVRHSVCFLAAWFFIGSYALAWPQDKTPQSPERLARLEALNRQLVETDEPEQVVSHDDEWHRELLAGCPNPVLVELIEQFIRRTRRYELALMQERRNVLSTVQDHEEIMAALRTRDPDGACVALRQNMESGTEAIVAWLRDHSTES
jgi:DNA-binding GntR family transcriptional regulator